MNALLDLETGPAPPVGAETSEFDLYVRGVIPSCLAGSLIVATSRRHKTRSRFARWHDSQADLLKLDVSPGRPGKVRASFLAIDGRWAGDGPPAPAPFYTTQPNHGLNCSANTVWATNLLFGAPLEIDLASWRPRRVLRYLQPSEDAPQVTSTSHFAWSLDGRYAYFHQSLLKKQARGRPVRATALTLIELDTVRGSERTWRILPPPDDATPEDANFHSAFYYEEGGRRFVGLLRTGAVLEALEPHRVPDEHRVIPMKPSTIWVVEVREDRNEFPAFLLPGVRELGGFALSHLDIDARSRDGFVLYANYKQADVAEETHGQNLYGEPPEQVPDHYSGMIIEPFNFGQVIRYARDRGTNTLETFSRPYVPGKTSLGHSWLPINLQLDSRRERLFCSFGGFHPRLLPRHVALAYQGLVADVSQIRHVPPLLMRFDAGRLRPDIDPKRRHLSYAESIAFTLVPGEKTDYICTFAPEVGLRIYDADDLTTMVAYGVAAELMTYRETHFRPVPAHMQFVPR
jgi:hypothetical protein